MANREELENLYCNAFISVDVQKKSGRLLSAGTAPFYHDEKGKVIPHGYRFFSILQGRSIVGETKVEEIGTVPFVYYRFIAVFEHGQVLRNASHTLQNPRSVEGKWKLNNASGALKDLAKQLADVNAAFVNLNVKENGALQVGVTYPLMQAVLRCFHPDQFPPVPPQAENKQEEEGKMEPNKRLQPGTPEETPASDGNKYVNAFVGFEDEDQLLDAMQFFTDGELPAPQVLDEHFTEW